MPSYFTPLSALHSGTSSGSSGRTVHSPDTSAPAPATLPLTTDPLAPRLIGRWTSIPGGGPLQSLITPDRIVTSVQVVVTAGAGEPMVLTARRGEKYWLATDDTGVTELLDNGGSTCIDDRSVEADGPLYAWTPVPAIVFDGPTLAAWAVPPTTAVVTWTTAQRYTRAYGAALWGDFRDTPVDPTGRVLCNDRLRDLSSRGGGLFPTQANIGAPGGPAYPPKDTTQDAVLAECVFAGPSAFGAVWCDASDVGVSTSERLRLPVDLASNNAAAYRRYPAAFFRRPTFVRGVQLAQPSSIVGNINTPEGAPCIYVTTEDLVASAWLLKIDGAVFRVALRHEQYAGLRRPADVWNRVIVGALASNVPIDLYFNDPGASFPYIGNLARMEFLEYATFLDGYKVVEGVYTTAYELLAQQGATI